MTFILDHVSNYNKQQNNSYGDCDLNFYDLFSSNMLMRYSFPQNNIEVYDIISRII